MKKDKTIDMDEEKLINEEAEESQEKAVSEEQDGVSSEINDLQTKLVRLQADFQNYKKRVEKEKDDLVSIGVVSIANEILPVIDNFERALEHEGDSASFKEGMELIYEGLKNALKAKGIVELKALGEDFNPDFHQAVSMGHNDEYKENQVIEVLLKGYEYNGKVIRHAMVIVNK
ncbi:nucleotide exchange factor GrpE [Fenollaria massiliensis]|uniref:Protein GrpE n=1 Tax=Fenollaria massiliensis TaxID=938288 RepID=A0A9E7ITN7_9FIRM|nr:nucleotide exchange factor GrpE [Fenollaria massiliensis]UQK58628.1 nucleotide exchange factor GrpE [Fenollaria massiliensis]